MRGFEVLDSRATPLGELSLRRRREPVTGTEVFEVKLGDEFLMSSLFSVAEVALAQLALERLPDGPLDVVVGGLGLGYTAAAVLADPRVREAVVVEALDPVIGWHRDGLVPLGPELTADPRCRFLPADFFALCSGPGFDPERPGRAFDAVLVDIDHSPRHRLAEDGGDFYTADGLRALAGHLRAGGVYALWSNDPPDPGYLDRLGGSFVDVTAEVVRFPNPLQDREAANTIYLATRPAGAAG